MKLYGTRTSGSTRTVLTVLAEKNATFEMNTIDMTAKQHKSPEYLAKQPFGQIPVFEDDDGFVLFESRAIMRYLDAKLPGVQLTPSDPKSHALMEQWISVEMSSFSPAAFKVVGQVYFNPMRGAPTDQGIVEEGRVATNRVLDVMEKQLEKTKYLVGDQFTLADVTHMRVIQYLHSAKNQDLIEARPACNRWWKEISGRDSWKKVLGDPSST